MDHLFVVTYGRSGSTLLMKVLNAIDGFCIRGENGGVLQDMAQAVNTLAVAKAEHALANESESKPWFGIGEADPERLALDLAESFTRNVLKPDPDTRVTGFKEIRYTPRRQDDATFDAMMRFMATHFARSRFIFNTRDARAVSQSGWWRDRKRFKERYVLDMVNQCDERFNRWADTLGERAFMIDYAEYDGAPEGFVPLLDWMGEELPMDKLREIGARRLDHATEMKPRETALEPRKRGFFRF